MKVFLTLVALVLPTAMLTSCGGGSSPIALAVSITPSSVTESEFHANYESFTLTAEAQDTGAHTITYNYQWYKNDEAIAGATGSTLDSNNMVSQGHTIRGYEFKCSVTGTDEDGNVYAGEASVTIGGPTLSIDRGVLFHNLFRGYALNEGANSSLAVMKDRLNPTMVSIGIVYFQTDPTSTDIYEKDAADGVDSTITESDLVSQIEYAHSLGLKVMLYPEVWIDNYGATGPRDEISGSDEWFAEYGTVITHLAEIAEENGVEIFCVGVELRDTQDREEKWRQLIQDVRSRFSGVVTYSSMYYEGVVDAINWWDAVDYIGVTCNFETSIYDPNLGADPTLDQLRTVYEQYRGSLEQLGAETGKQIMVTESGVFSVDGGTITHVQYSDTQIQYGDTSDFQEQADYFEAVLEIFVGEEWIVGFTILDWFPTQEEWYQDDPVWPFNTAVINKYAERVIKSWYSP